MADEDMPEAASDPQTADLLGWAGKTLYWILWPIGFAIYQGIYYFGFASIFVLKLAYKPLEFILLPVFYFGRFLLECLIAPFKFLAKFETLYIYLGIAAIAGVGLGFLVSFTYDALRKPLGLDNEPQQPGRTAKQYREEKRKRKTKAEAPQITAGYASPNNLSMSDGKSKTKRGKGLASQTIMEELDSDY